MRYTGLATLDSTAPSRIKVLPGEVASDPRLKQRFEQEARAVAALSHPHICTLHDIGRHDETDFLVMEYLEGETLAARLERGALPLAEALRTAIQICGALDRAHDEGVVHRDLKPGNIMLTRTGAKLLDFGLAKLRPGTASGGATTVRLPTDDLTGAGEILGTIRYMSPEQLEGRPSRRPRRHLSRSARWCTRWSPGGRRSPPTARPAWSEPS